MVKHRGELESPLPALREFAAIVAVRASHRLDGVAAQRCSTRFRAKLNHNLHHHNLVKPFGLGLGVYRSKLLQATVTRIQGH